MHIENHTRDINIFCPDTFWFARNCLIPEIGEIGGTKYLVSVDDVSLSDGEVF